MIFSVEMHTLRRHLRVYKPCIMVDNDKAVTHMATPLAHTSVKYEQKLLREKTHQCK